MAHCGEVEPVKLYMSNNTGNNHVEILLDYSELKKLIHSLVKFGDEINVFKIKNNDNGPLGFTHLHLKDCGLISEKCKSDIVFYVNLDE
jgi:hypothetical protein